MRKLHEKAENQRQHDPQNSTDAGQRHGFSDELKANVALARANGLTHSDFARSLGYGHKHDVHYANAAHQEAHGNHAHDQLEDARHDVAKLDAKLFRAADAKSVRLVRRDAAAGPQKATNLVFRHALHAWKSCSDQGNLIILRIVFFVGPRSEEHTSEIQ